jgi:hypothetical protein
VDWRCQCRSTHQYCAQGRFGSTYLLYQLNIYEKVPNMIKLEQEMSVECVPLAELHQIECEFYERFGL